MTAAQEKAASLYREFGPVVYRRCLRLLRDKEAARDATQEIFVKLVGNMARLEERANALPWIFQVATNHCLNLRRDARRRGEDAAVPVEDAPELALRPDTSADLYPERQLSQKVLSRFDAQTQAVAVGVLVDGMEHAEVAQVLGVSAKTVSRKLDRFLANARKILTRSES